MPGVTAPAWLVRRDPGLLVVRRAARVTLVACVGFFVCRYALGNAVMAPYALFGAVALGALAQIPGSPAQRARTLLAVLPVGWVLVTLGTLLAVSTPAAAAGMLVLGFAISLAAVGGPRLVGLTTGVQLLYILPCFPPYDPGSLGWRLAGLTLAVLLLAAAELVVWPDPTPEPYTAKLATAVDALADCLDAVADRAPGRGDGPDRFASLLPAATGAAEALRPSGLPPTERPASAGRRDRALMVAAATARLLLGRAVDLHDAARPGAAGDAVTGPVAALLDRTASCGRAAAAWLRTEGRDGTPPPDTERIVAALAEFRAARAATPSDGVAPDRLRLGALALGVGEWTTSLVAAIRVVARQPVHADGTPPTGAGPLWFAAVPTARLWWLGLREHLTPRSVFFQGALRLAAALAVARLLAGVLDLTHGFWVLLTILTLLRTSAAGTRSTLWPALVGTALGALVAAAVLVAGIPPAGYAAVLPVVMLVGLAAGPLLGLAWAQGLFTLVIALVFAQVSPVDWHLAQARVVDVALGAAIGVATGLLAWPRGGSGELHRAAGTFLAAAARVVRETADVLARGGRRGDALPRARVAGELAQASWVLYQTEPHPLATVDWQDVLVAGHHAVRGAEALLRECPTGRLLPGAGALSTVAADVADRYARVADGLLRHDRDAVAAPLPAAPRVEWPTDLGADRYHLADLRVWLDGLRDDLGRLAGAAGPVDLRRRGAHLVEEAG